MTLMECIGSPWQQEGEDGTEKLFHCQETPQNPYYQRVSAVVSMAYQILTWSLQLYAFTSSPVRHRFMNCKRNSEIDPRNSITVLPWLLRPSTSKTINYLQSNLVIHLYKTLFIRLDLLQFFLCHIERHQKFTALHSLDYDVPFKFLHSDLPCVERSFNDVLFKQNSETSSSCPS